MKNLNIPLYGDTGKLILRVVTSGLLLFHGIHKLIYGLDFIRLLLLKHCLPQFLTYGVPIGEIVAPILILVGLGTRFAALITAFTMLMSIYLFFGNSAFNLDQFGGVNCQLNIFFLLASLSIFCLGEGKYSISQNHQL